ncbi:hypothetical protein SAMN05192562_103284 [Kosakonia arachidis]|uniref:Uncharacterized protein n=1 Tax=Kosakonia arachidis TaxID=551989 RepID=A0A1I7C6F2_9ENTR|nr:hypothetical protein SAMN05192562_103284 [Kosakonia arachidis]
MRKRVGLYLPFAAMQATIAHSAAK